MSRCSPASDDKYVPRSFGKGKLLRLEKCLLCKQDYTDDYFGTLCFFCNKAIERRSGAWGKKRGIAELQDRAYRKAMRALSFELRKNRGKPQENHGKPRETARKNEEKP